MMLQLYEPGRRVDDEAVEASFSRDDIAKTFEKTMAEHIPLEMHEQFVDGVWQGMNLLVPSAKVSMMQGTPISVQINDAVIEQRQNELDERLVDLSKSQKKLLLFTGAFGMAVMNGIQLVFPDKWWVSMVPLGALAGVYIWTRWIRS